MHRLKYSNHSSGGGSPIYKMTAPEKRAYVDWLYESLNMFLRKIREGNILAKYATDSILRMCQPTFFVRLCKTCKSISHQRSGGKSICLCDMLTPDGLSRR